MDAGFSCAGGSIHYLESSESPNTLGLILRSPSLKRVHARLRRAMARASRRMAASPNLPPWFETARIAAKCTQAAPAMARLLTMRPSVLNSYQIAKIERFTASQDDGESS